MTTVSETAPAKINLYLHVGPVRVDGFHELASLFVFTDYGDEVIVEEDDALSLEIVGPFAQLLAGASLTENLVYRAAQALQDYAGVNTGARMRLVKNLPVAAGVGGGSADAAAALRALEKLWALTIPAEDMRALAFKLGADVPACLERKPVLVDGAGEILSPGPDLPTTTVLLVNPRIDMPTGPVFKRFDADNASQRHPAHPDGVDGSVSDLAGLMTASRNDLEPAAMALAPKISDLVTSMQSDPGAIAARMSGSGATCFAFFDDAGLARDAAQKYEKMNYWTMVSPVASV